MSPVPGHGGGEDSPHLAAAVLPRPPGRSAARRRVSSAARQPGRIVCRRAQAPRAPALLAPAAAGASHGRLQLSLYAGGGLASDLFVGAGLGHEGLLELQPGSRLDLSFSPEWKASARLGAGYAAFTASG